MGKLIIFFLLVSLTQNEIISSKVNPQIDDVAKYEYWSTFSETFDKTADFWKAESKALEAESIAEDRTGVKEWLVDNKNKLIEKESKKQC